ncbi:MAG: tetratricopeptide repeat-containing sensor histidine kinase [Bacteroidetes bacterium]|nr:tetratricopeptide repeat-containing sensor histidine kinase [Bacteroidota bacterium]
MFNKSLSTVQKKDDFGSIAENLNNIGHIYKRRKENSKALINFDKALKYYKNLKDSSGIAITLNNIGEVQILIHEYKGAVDNLKAALVIASKINMKPALLDIYKNLIEANKFGGNYFEAVRYYDQYTVLYKDVYNEETSKQVTQLNTKYQSELKEKTIRSLEAEQKLSILEVEKEKTLRNSLVIIAIILLIFSTAIFYQFRSKVKTNRLLTRINNEKEILNKEISLQNERLQRSEESLKSINATKDRFFSIIAHDLKNPFITIMGFSDLLLADYAELSDDERLFYLEEMKKTAELSHNLLQNLLQWSRSQTGRIEFNPQRLELINLVNKNFLLLKNAAEKKQIRLQQEIPSAMTVSADEEMLNTVFRNLLTNAVKFSKKGGIISVSANARDNFSEVCVSDTGVGMDEKTMDKLFKLDVTCSTPGTANEEGTGLGLILCKEFIEKNQGKIWIESELGKGSKFFFTLPL